jgi:hypothetical protein
MATMKGGAAARKARERGATQGTPLDNAERVDDGAVRHEDVDLVPHDPPTVADQLHAFRRQVLDATGAVPQVERTPLPDGRVRMVVKFGDGTAIGGEGATTADAFTAMRERASAFTKATGGTK